MINHYIKLTDRNRALEEENQELKARLVEQDLTVASEACCVQAAFILDYSFTRLKTYNCLIPAVTTTKMLNSIFNDDAGKVWKEADKAAFMEFLEIETPNLLSENRELQIQVYQLKQQLARKEEELCIVDWQINYLEKGKDIREIFGKYKQLKIEHKEVCTRL